MQSTRSEVSICTNGYNDPCVSLKILQEVIKNTPMATIQAANGTVCGTIPEINMRYLSWFVSMREYKFNESDSKHLKVRLHDSYDEERTKFFCNIMNKIPFENLEMTKRELVWFCALMDDYSMKIELIEYFLDRIDSYSVDWNVMNEIIKLYHAKTMGQAVQNLYDKFKNKCLSNSTIDLDCIPPSCFTYSFGRRLLCSMIKTGQIENETEFAIKLINKIKEINQQQTDHRVSIKAVYDLLAGVNWFYVKSLSVMNLLDELKQSYPGFAIPERITSAFTIRKTLIESYKHRTGSTFKYKAENIGGLRPRSCCTYSKTFTRSASFSVYTTTVEPELISMSAQVTKTSRRKTRRSLGPSQTYIVISQSHNHIPEDKYLCAQFIIKYHCNGEEVITPKIWTFGQPYKLPVNENLINSNITITFQMIYFDLKSNMPEKRIKPTTDASNLIPPYSTNLRPSSYSSDLRIPSSYSSDLRVPSYSSDLRPPSYSSDLRPPYSDRQRLALGDYSDSDE